MKTAAFFSLIFIQFSILAQPPKLVAGPMQGHTTSNSIKIWLLTKDVEIVTLSLSEITDKTPLVQSISTDTVFNKQSYFPLTFSFSGLKPSTEYSIQITLDGKPLEEKFSAKTLSDESAKDFSFLLGSCVLTPPPILRMIYPGQKEKIFSKMKNTDAGFMLWLGDNLYYRKKDRQSADGMFARQVKKRKLKLLNAFLATMPQYAIWDDHDFGPNNSNSSFPLRDSSLQIHQNFWANPYYGTAETKGTFSNFGHYDCDFFLTDGRYHKKLPDESGATILGEGQINWLLDALKKSTASFKFIAIGTQFVNEHCAGEHHNEYPAERQRIIDFIFENNITGVIFLSGDMHYSQLAKAEFENGYPLYDFSCSPLTGLVYHTPVKENPQRIENKRIEKRNFGKFSISGENGNRKCLIEVFDSKRKKLWEYTIQESQLKK
ncbi:alkaline phosphatase family protein [Bacteroidales bacterium AH-315-I05]|nr:alkaline phosphatase family protein [Bacteroidales bacterium AH-315-I05]